MRRWVGFISLTLALGALATVLVAWLSAGVFSIWYRGATVQSTGDWRNQRESPLMTTGWGRVVYDFGIAGTHIDLEPGTATLLTIDLLSPRFGRKELPAWDASRTRCDGDRSITHISHGWPMRALLSTEVTRPYRSFESTASTEIALGGGIPIVSVSLGLFERTALGVRRSEIFRIGPFAMEEGVFARLPLQPILPGFVADTLVFAGVWVVLLQSWPTWRAVHRAWRRARFRCPWCGHQRHDAASPECSECGRSLEERTLMPSRAVMVLAAVAAVLLLAANLSWMVMLRKQLLKHDDPIETAIQESTIPQVLALLDAQKESLAANPNARIDWVDQSALQSAALAGHLELARALVERGARPCGEPFSLDGPSALEAAIEGGDRATIDFLLASLRVDSDPLDRDRVLSCARVARCRSLVVAARHSDAVTLRALLSIAPTAVDEALVPCFPDECDELLRTAARAREPAALEVLLMELRRQCEVQGAMRGASLPVILDRSRSLLEAVRWRRHVQVSLLLQAGADVRDAPYGTPLIAAILSGDPTLVQRMLDAGAAPDSDECPSVSIAAAFHQHEMVRMLVDAGADPNRDHFILGPPLCAAREMKMPSDTIRLLLELGANERDCRGQ